MPETFRHIVSTGTSSRHYLTVISATLWQFAQDLSKNPGIYRGFFMDFCPALSGCVSCNPATLGAYVGALGTYRKQDAPNAPDRCCDTQSQARRQARKAPHRSQFDPAVVKRQLGITVASWDGFVERMRALVKRPLDSDSVEGLLRRVLTYAGQDGKAPVVNEQAVASVRALYAGGGRGALMASSHGTAWGLLNGVTEFIDHHRRARSDDHRRDAAWFGQGAQIKQRAWDEVIKLAA